jgi:thymidine phosphorylase
MRSIRAKMYGQKLNYEALQNIINDIVKGEYSNIEIAASITACGGDNLSIDEIIGLTKAMVISGQRLSWIKNCSRQALCRRSTGNRTTPISVAIVAALGLTIPKTSSSCNYIPSKQTAA